jgi:hypothetical protein
VYVLVVQCMFVYVLYVTGGIRYAIQVRMCVRVMVYVSSVFCCVVCLFGTGYVYV